MKTIIVKSLVNSENSHPYPGELLYKDTTSNTHPYNALKLHFNNCSRAIETLGLNAIVTSKVIVCCSTLEDFRRPVLDVEHIHKDILYTDKSIVFNGVNNQMSDFRHFYGELTTVMKFCSIWKSLYTNNIAESATKTHNKISNETFKNNDYLNLDSNLKKFAFNLNIRYHTVEINGVDI